MIITFWYIFGVNYFPSDIDECATSAHVCVCHTGLVSCLSLCINEDGGYTCGCNAGYGPHHTDRRTCIGLNKQPDCYMEYNDSVHTIELDACIRSPRWIKRTSITDIVGDRCITITGTKASSSLQT